MAVNRAGKTLRAVRRGRAQWTMIMIRAPAAARSRSARVAGPTN